MKRTACLILCLTLLAASALCLAPAADDPDPAAYNTSVPSWYYDFSGSLYDSVIANVSFTMDDSKGYLHLTAIQDDPNLAMIVPRVPLEQMVWARIGYRLDVRHAGRYAEIYYAADNGEALDERTKIKWTWEDDSGDWAAQTVYMSSFDGKPGVYLTSFRFDALAGQQQKIEAGEVIDLAYIAFFATEEEADAFDPEGYAKYLEAVEKVSQETEGETTPRVIEPGDYAQPEPQDVVTRSADNVPGSLTMTHNGDGTLTVSYLLNGETVTYTVPDRLQNTYGPLAGEDDLGRTLWDMYTTVDPTYNGRTLNGRDKVYRQDPFTIGAEGERSAREVGIFYFLWLGEHGDNGIQDITKILGQYGDQAGLASCPGWGPVFSIHHFAEPLYGYYYSIDTWVMRKHVELLTNAGVDFLYFDTTNNYAYTENVLRLMAILHEFNLRGYEAPKVCFYTHTGAAERVKTIYNAIYKKNLYPDTWYTWEDKPLIIAPASANIDGFFTTREPQWPNEQQKKNAWPWIDWNWPQKVYRDAKNKPEAVSVSVAQHAGNGCFSESGLYGYEDNWGRSFNGSNALLTADSYKLGLNIQNEFNFAMTVDTPVVLVTGWNEWIAGRQPQIKDGQPVVFIDTFSYEYSRDIEMSRGGYFDNYYMQLISNIAAIKGAAPTLVQDARNAINITGGFSQWDKVLVDYPDPEGDTVERDCISFGHTKLTDTTGRNDITDVKVTNDLTYLYFYIRTADTIVRPEAGKDSAWMQLMLNVDCKSTGWYGYDFILNGHPKSDTVTTLDAYGESGFAPVQDINYRVCGNEIMFAVPMEYLGITECDRVCVQFKAVDSDNVVDEAEDLYIEGDCAPLGRPNFVYQTYIPGVTVGDGTPVLTLAERAMHPGDVVTEAPTESPATAGTTEPAGTEDATKPGKSGCGSALTAGAALLAVVCCAAVTLRKKQTEF